MRSRPRSPSPFELLEPLPQPVLVLPPPSARGLVSESDSESDSEKEWIRGRGEAGYDDPHLAPTRQGQVQGGASPSRTPTWRSLRHPWLNTMVMLMQA